MNDLQAGTIHAVTVKKVTEANYLVTKRDTEMTMLKEYATKELKINDMIDVFLYHNKANELEATMTIPDATFHTYDWAEVIEVVPHYGAFVQIGLPREVLLPYDELPLFKSAWPKTGDKLYVTLTHDKQERLLAKLGTEESFDDLYEFAGEVDLNDEVTGRAIRVDREGTVMITNDPHYRAFIHHTEMEKEPRLGEVLSGRVIEVKEDGSINVSLLPLKHERIDTDAETILEHLQEADGAIPFSDKSSPEDIQSTFNMSKSAFKRALGRLMRDRKITQTDGKTILTEEEEE